MQSLRGKVKPKDAEDRQIKNLLMMLTATGPGCYVKAGDCKKGFALYLKIAPEALPTVYEKMDAEQRKTSLKSSFEGIHATCKARSRAHLNNQRGARTLSAAAGARRRFAGVPGVLQESATRPWSVGGDVIASRGLLRWALGQAGPWPASHRDRWALARCSSGL